MAKEMTKKEIAAYIKGNFMYAVKPYEISDSQLDAIVEVAMSRPFAKNKSTIKNYLFHSVGLTWKF